MEKMLKEIMKKKKPDMNMDPNKKKAKMDILKEISGMAADDMGEGMKSYKKVTVAAPDSSGLKEGLKKAEDMVGNKSSSDESESPSTSKMDMSNESEAEDMVGTVKDYVESCDMTPEQIDEVIKALEAKKHTQSM